MFADVHLENAIYCQITSGFVDPARLSNVFGKPRLTNILYQGLTGIRRAKCQVNIFTKKLWDVTFYVYFFLVVFCTAFKPPMQMSFKVSAPANFQHSILPSKSFSSKFRWCNMHIWCSFFIIPSHLRENLLKSWQIYRKLKKNFHFRY